MIIGLTGYAQSGKDSVAKVLVQNYGFQRIAFADKIRELLYQMNPIISTVANEPMYLRGAVDRDGWDVTKQSQEVRRLLQDLGVGARHVFGDNHWVVEALKSIDRENNYVITDVRFMNEAEWVKDVYNGILWSVDRPGVRAVNNHISEREMEAYPVDAILKNSGTLDDLEEMVHQRMETLLAN